MGSERRKYLRIATDQVVSFAQLDRPDQLAIGRNLSTGGIRFDAVGCELELGDVLRVTFNVGEQTIATIGRVVRATELDPITLDVGIEFIEIDPMDLRLLEESSEAFGMSTDEIEERFGSRVILIGSVDRFSETLAAWSALGVERFHMQRLVSGRSVDQAGELVELIKEAAP